MDGSWFGPEPVSLSAWSPSDAGDESVFDCIEVIRTFGELPDDVRIAPVARIDGRLLDRRLLSQLISQPPPPDSDVGWSDRILKREESLMPHLGKVLFCALIRLPGVQYTVEIDPLSKAVVHWEWQAA